MSARRGFLLAEALCALALAGVLAVATGSALLQARRLLATAEARARAERAGVEALQIVGALVRDADSLVVLGDTAVEFQARIADGVVCARVGDALFLPPARPSVGRPLVSLVQPIEMGDEVRAWVEDPVTGYRAWVSAPVESLTTRTGDAPCGSAGGFADANDAGAARIRVVVSMLDARVRAGTPLRVGRRGRLALYSVGAGQWMLGWRRCANGTCGVVQPVAGPFRSPTLSGFRVRDLGGGMLQLSAGPAGIPGIFESLVVRTDAGR